MNGLTADQQALFRYREQHGELSESFVVQLVKRLRDQDPRVTPALQWLEEQLINRGTTSDEMVHKEHQRQGAANVTVRNIITSMRLISDVNWPEFFEDVSLVDAALRAASDLASMDFADPQPVSQRDRSAVTSLAAHRARNCACTDRRHLGSQRFATQMRSASATRDITCSDAGVARSNASLAIARR